MVEANDPESCVHMSLNTPDSRRKLRKMSPGSTAAETGPSRTFSDSVFHVVLAIHGLKSRFTPRRWMRLASVVFWLTALMFFPYSAPLFVYDKVVLKKRLSLSQITTSFSAVSFSCFSSYSALLLRWKHTEIEPLLRKRGRTVRNVPLFLMLIIPELILDYVKAPRERGFVACISFYTYTLQYFSTLVTFMIYNDLADELILKLSKLCIAVRDSGPNNELIRTRWGYRDQIRRINSIFALPLCLFYMQMLLTTIHVTADLILQDLAYSVVFLTTLSYACIVFQLLFVAYKASNVRAMSEEIGRQFLKRANQSRDTATIDATAIRALVFDEDRDSLRVGCYTHSLPNFLRFVSVMTTCVAVVLQFDFRVVRTISDLSGLS